MSTQENQENENNTNISSTSQEITQSVNITSDELVWDLTIFDQLRFSRIFKELSNDAAFVTLNQVGKHYKLEDFELIDIWCLCNPLCTNKLTREQFTVFNWLLQEKEKGLPLPNNLCDIPKKMPEKYWKAVNCKESVTNEVVGNEIPLETTFINMQTKFDKLSGAVSQHKLQCNETKNILKSLKAQAENMLKSLYKREIRIATEQMNEHDLISPKLQYAKDEIISLQLECATNIQAIQAQYNLLQLVQYQVDRLMYEANDLKDDKIFECKQESPRNEYQDPLAIEFEFSHSFERENNFTPKYDSNLDKEE